MSTFNIEDEKRKARAIIEKLPQRSLIPNARIDKWLEAMARREPERLVWHALRQSGFSGSEVGTLVANRRGFRAHFGSARKLVMQKLFMMTPDFPNEHMERGIETEDLHRIKFMKLWNAERDLQAYDKLTHSRGRYDFLRYSPDDVVTIQGHRVLVDYKSPSDVSEETVYDFDYQCQINLGADIMSLNGVPATYGMLSRLCWKDWKCVGTWVEINPVLQEEIIDSAHHYWTRHVLAGEAPDFVQQHKPAEFGEEDMNAIRLLSAQVVALDEVKSRLEEERDRLNDGMRTIAKKSQATGKASVFSHNLKSYEEVNRVHFVDVIQTLGMDPDEEIQKVSVPAKYDEEKILAALTERGIDLNPFVKLSILDIEKVKARLTELNVDVETVIDINYDIRKTNNKKPEVMSFKPIFKAAAVEVQRHLTETALREMGVEQPEEPTPEEVAAMVESESDHELLVM